MPSSSGAGARRACEHAEAEPDQSRRLRNRGSGAERRDRGAPDLVQESLSGPEAGDGLVQRRSRVAVRDLQQVQHRSQRVAQLDLEAVVQRAGRISHEDEPSRQELLHGAAFGEEELSGPGRRAEGVAARGGVEKVELEAGQVDGRAAGVEELDELVDGRDGSGPGNPVVRHPVAARVLGVVGLRVGHDLRDQNGIGGGGRQERGQEEEKKEGEQEKRPGALHHIYTS
ncbi:MAG: hypothetical protein ACYTGI_05260 [Planctomycetota bacterium]